MSRADLVVLGAGPAGVGAAYRAARRGLRVVVLERASGPGGASGSFDVAGVRVDHGSHRLHTSVAPEILDELRSLLGPDLQLRRRNGRIRLAGRWIAFPLRVSDLARRLPRDFALAAARDALLAPSRRPRADTFAEVVRAGLGPAMAERFYFPYARKLWGVEPEEIAGEQARRRISAGSPLKLVSRIVGRGQTGLFWYPRRGYGQISEALADASGADIRYETAATALELGDDGARVDGVEADRVFSTIPLAALSRLAGGPDAGRLELRAMLLVYLVLDRGRYTPFDAHYLPEAWTPVTRVSEPKNYRDGDDPSSRTVLCAEIPCARGDDLWQERDERLGALVAETLVEAGLPRPEPLEVVVKRMAAVYPIYRVGWEEHFERLDAWAAAQPRLLTFGRQGLFVHDNTHHALAMAWAAIDAIREDGSFDEAAWRTARERFRTHVVED